jgi:hypothetical protein
VPYYKDSLDKCLKKLGERKWLVSY